MSKLYINNAKPRANLIKHFKPDDPYKLTKNTTIPCEYTMLGDRNR